MKLFHTEKEKTTVYVQMQDIMFVFNKENVAIPAPIIQKCFSGVTIVDDSNRFDFVKFDEESVVSFFKGLDFIIDYNDYKDLTDEQIQQKYKNIVDEYNSYAKKWNNMSESERKNNLNLLSSINNSEYILQFIQEIYAMKHNERHMNIPTFVND